MKKEIYIHITSAQGPDECERGVYLLVEEIKKEAFDKKTEAEIVYYLPGERIFTIQSAIIKITGEDADLFVKSFCGSIQWIVQSPYRKFHKRKNWFMGVYLIEKPEKVQWNLNDVRFETKRASGAGGQHVNKTESAVKAIHIPTGISVTVSESRSQHENRKKATLTLKLRLLENHSLALLEQQEKNRKQHFEVSRGNAVRTYHGEIFRRVR